MLLENDGSLDGGGEVILFSLRARGHGGRVFSSARGDREAAARLGARGHERARRQFSLDAFASRFERIYRDAVASRGVGA